MRRAVIYLMESHPQAAIVSQDRSEEDGLTFQMVRLNIGYADAAKWLRRNAELFQHLQLSRSTFRKAAKWWQTQGVADASSSRLLVEFVSLRKWVERRIEARETCDLVAIDRLRSTGERVPACPSVSQRVPRVSEGDSYTDSSLENKTTDSSLTHSTGTSKHALPPVPFQAFDSSLKESALHSNLKQWWEHHELKDVIEYTTLLGAVLAARKNAKSSPHGYLRTCLRSGIQDGFIVQAKLIQKQAGNSLATYSPR